MSPTPSSELRSSGRLALDLTWTLRYRDLRPTELLASPDDLRAWLDTVGLPVPATATRRDLEGATALREATYRAATAVIDGRRIRLEDRDTINDFAARPPFAPVLAADGTRRLVATHGGPARAALSAVARDAIELLTAQDGRLRRCEGPMCSLLFHDSSRPGTRRWCRTTGCGNKVNTKAYRTRRRGAEAGSRE